MICSASEPPPNHKEEQMTYKSDEEIRNDALFQLDWDSRLRRSDISVNAIPVEPERVKSLIEDVLERRADREANRIRVSVDEGEVTLTGAVKSWDEKKAILGAVGHAPGVKMIHDHLFIDPYDARFASA